MYLFLYYIMPGCTFRKDKNHWYIQIAIHGTKKTKYIGSTKTEFEAKRMYDKYIRDNDLTDQYKLNYPRSKPLIKKKLWVEIPDQLEIPPSLF